MTIRKMVDTFLASFAPTTPPAPRKPARPQSRGFSVSSPGGFQFANTGTRIEEDRFESLKSLANRMLVLLDLSTLGDNVTPENFEAVLDQILLSKEH